MQQTEPDNHNRDVTACFFPSTWACLQSHYLQLLLRCYGPVKRFRVGKSWCILVCAVILSVSERHYRITAVVVARYGASDTLNKPPSLPCPNLSFHAWQLGSGADMCPRPAPLKRFNLWSHSSDADHQHWTRMISQSHHKNLFGFFTRERNALDSSPWTCPKDARRVTHRGSDSGR